MEELGWFRWGDANHDFTVNPDTFTWSEDWMEALRHLLPFSFIFLLMVLRIQLRHTMDVFIGVILQTIH